MEYSAVLEPFAHQVTGTSHMLSLNDTTLCKSLLPRELLFYTSIPEDLRPFTPKLKGVLYAKLKEVSDDDSYKFTTTQLFFRSNSLASDEMKEIENASEAKTNWKKDSSSQSSVTYENILFKGLERFKYDTMNGFTNHPWTVDKDAEAIIESVGANPWAIRQHRHEINKMLSKKDSARGQAKVQDMVDVEGACVDRSRPDGMFLKGYLMLENVSSSFTHPNVIDFKLGRQIERDDCSQAKKTKHAGLVKNSSTGTLMLRLAGMQVYQVDSGHYLCRDKYYGRGLSSDGFREVTRQFLHNGRRLIIEIIPSIVEKLLSLRAMLEKQSTFRFYASSLLIVYEGGDIEGDSCESNTTNDHCLSSQGEHGIDTSTPSRKVDVKMIDFAHSTYKGFNGDKNIHEGPDVDCLQALENLIKVLKEIEATALNHTESNQDD